MFSQLQYPTTQQHTTTTILYRKTWVASVNKYSLTLGDMKADSWYNSLKYQQFTKPVFIKKCVFEFLINPPSKTLHFEIKKIERLLLLKIELCWPLWKVYWQVCSWNSHNRLNIIYDKQHSGPKLSTIIWQFQLKCCIKTLYRKLLNTWNEMKCQVTNKKDIMSTYILGTPDTSLSGLRTRNVLNIARSGPAAFPSSDFGISIGKNLKNFLCILCLAQYGYKILSTNNY